VGEGREGGRRDARVLKAVSEAGRDTPIVAEPDVLVVGGGAAGIAAACAAARAGARTLLVERYGFLGGTLTAVTLGGFCGTHAVVDDRQLRRIVGGLYLDVEERLRGRDAVLPPRRHGQIVGFPYDSVTLKLVADELVRHFGVRTLAPGRRSSPSSCASSMRFTHSS